MADQPHRTPAERAIGNFSPELVRLKNRTAVPLKLKSVQQRENDALWLCYEVVRPKEF